MAVPRAYLRLVDPVASRVTELLLVSFRRFMRSPRIPRLAPLAAVLAAIASSVALFIVAPAVRAACGTASSPCPTPVNAFISLDPTAGDSNTLVNVSGGQFLPNEDMTLYWDQADHVAGTAHADANGSFNARVRPIATDAPGVHRLCASVPPNPCANFALQAVTPTPTELPSPSPSPVESPSPSPTPVVVAPLSSHGGGSLGLDIITKPPFVFLPIAGAAAIMLAFAFWLFALLRRPKQANESIPTSQRRNGHASVFAMSCGGAAYRRAYSPSA